MSAIAILLSLLCGAPDGRLVFPAFNADRRFEGLRASKMINAVTTAHQPEPLVTANGAQTKATASATPSQKPTQTASSSGAPVDTVQISSAAQAASKETLETSAQTAKEATGGDHKAQRLLAKEAAAEKG